MGLETTSSPWCARAAFVASVVAAAIAAPAGAAVRRPLAAVPAPAAVAPASNGRCVSDDGVDPQAAPTFRVVPAGPASAPPPADARVPRNNLLTLVQTAIRRSNAVGASRLLAEAAAIEIDEQRSARLPQATLSGQVGGVDAGAVNATSTHGAQVQAGLNVTAPLYDGGRVGASSTPSIHGMRYGVGIGARYYTNFGPFRLDVATPIARKPGESKVAVYISIGQAF